MVRRLGHANTEITAIKAIEVQLQTYSTSRSGSMRVNADVLFCSGYAEENDTVNLKSQKHFMKRKGSEAVLTILPAKKRTTRE